MEKIVPEIILNDGLIVPNIGFGTYNIKGARGVNTLENAISAGYRLFDTAYNYENEATVGQAIKRNSIPREKLVVTSKLPGRYHLYEDAISAIQESLYRADLDYYDLYLIHWPNPKQDHYTEAWQTLIDAQKFGLIRSIGVSNFLPEQLERLEKETGVLPSVNQIELHPYFTQEKQLAWNKEQGIQTQSWSPLGRANDILKNKTIKEIADTHQKSISQIILRWHVQLGSIPIPKSSSFKHQVDNLSIFDFVLSNEEMGLISALNKPDGRNKNQDPAVYEEF